MTFTVDIPDDKLRSTMDALWFAARQTEKLTSDHQQLLHDVGKQIRQQEDDQHQPADAATTGGGQG